MFPCKVKIDELDRKNTKVEDVDFSSNKNKTKGKIKKVATKAGEKTPFYFIADYFEKNGKPIADFLTLGNSPKLEKHFIKNEMKNSDSSFMDTKQDPKKAATGEVYVKDLNGKPTLHFEPHDKCKVPAGKWPKILKNMKAYFNGMKAVVVLDGQITEEEDGEDTTNESTNDNDNDTAANVETAIEEITPQELADNYKEILVSFKEVQKAEHDVDDVKILYRSLISWEKDYQKQPDAVKEKLANLYQSFDAILEGVKKTLKVDQLIGNKILEAEVIIREYLEIEDQNTPSAIQLCNQAVAMLDETIKYCKFVKDTDLESKCEALKTILES